LPGLDHNALHVINGDSAAGTFRRAIANTTRLIIARDVLSDGPLPAFLDIEAWKAQRVEFWKSLLDFSPEVDFRPRDSDMLQNIERLASASRVYVWAASGNTDQLMVAFLLELLERHGMDPGKIELIEFGRMPPNDRRVLQMGEVDLAQMRAHPTPRPLAVDEWMAYRQAWRALSSSDPARVVTFSNDNPHASEWLKSALRNLLKRYPARESGLGVWDMQLLNNVRERGPNAARAIGYTMGQNQSDGDLTSDLYQFSRLMRFASKRLPKPLVMTSGDERTLRGTSVELTDFGVEVAEGRASYWPSNPIDDWVGGVHLSSARDNLWFIQDGVIVRG
jgi:hypothetical protein